MELCTYTYDYVITETSSSDNDERQEETEVDNRQSSVIKTSDTRDPPNVAVSVRKRRK